MVRLRSNTDVVQAEVYKTFAEIQANNAAIKQAHTASTPADEKNEDGFDFSKFDDIDTDSDSDIEADIENDDIDGDDDEEVDHGTDDAHDPQGRHQRRDPKRNISVNQ